MQLRDVTTHYRRASRWYDAGGSIIFDGLLRLRRYRLLTIDLLGELGGARAPVPEPTCRCWCRA